MKMQNVLPNNGGITSGVLQFAEPAISFAHDRKLLIAGQARRPSQAGHRGANAAWRHGGRLSASAHVLHCHAGAMRLLVGMVRAAHHGADCRMDEAHLVGLFLEHLEGVRMHIAAYRQVVA